MKHTPGEWFVRETSEENTSRIVSENPDNCLANVYSGVGRNHSVITSQERIANAKLIAAAPELLEVVEKVLLKIRNKERIIWESEITTDLILAIKKATA